MKQSLLAIVAAVSIAIGTPTTSGGQPPGPPDRVTVCHKPGTPVQKTLTLPRKTAEKHIANHGDTLGACLVPPDRSEITQTFTDLTPTAPIQEEVGAPAENLDTTFPFGCEAVTPGPELSVDVHFWDGSIPEGTPLPGISETEAQETLALELAAAALERTWREAGVTGAPKTNDVAIHTALLRTSAEGSEILFFAGDGHDKEGSQRGDIDHTGVFRIINADANQFRVEKIASPPSDLFYAVHAVSWSRAERPGTRAAGNTIPTLRPTGTALSSTPNGMPGARGFH